VLVVLEVQEGTTGTTGTMGTTGFPKLRCRERGLSGGLGRIVTTAILEDDFDWPASPFTVVDNFNKDGPFWDRPLRPGGDEPDHIGAR
jgi:hypothetical protein